MYLTKENYRDIERWLKLRGIKDIKFPRTDRVRNMDLVPIIQDGRNKIISAREFALQLGCIYVPDEEDITSVDGFEGLSLKFNDKKVEPTLYSGMGRKFMRLKKDILPDFPIEEGKSGPKMKPLSIRKRKPLVNFLIQEDFPDADTVYIIQYDHDLKGETIVIPDNCALVFNGGTLNNGTITVNETQIYGVIQLSDTGDVTYNGTFYDGQIMSFTNKSYVLTDDLYNNDGSTLDKPEVRYWNGKEWEKLSLYDEVTELQEEMDEAQAAIDALEIRMDTAEADIDKLEVRMDTAEADIDALEGRMDTAEDDIDSLEVRMDTAESDIDSLEDRMTSAETTLKDHESRISTAEGTILKLDEWVAAIEQSIADWNTTVQNLQNSWLEVYDAWQDVYNEWQNISSEWTTVNNTINNISAALDNYYTKTEVDDLLANISNSLDGLDTGVGSVTYSATTTSSSTGAYVIGKLTIDGTSYTLYGVDTQGEDTDLSNYYTKSEVDTLIEGIDTGGSSGDGTGSTVSYTKSYTGTSGIKLGTLTIDGTAYVLYAPSLEDIIEYEYDVFKEYVTQVINEGDINVGGSTVSWDGALSEGTVIGTLTIDGTNYSVYAPTSGTSTGGFTKVEDADGNEIYSSSKPTLYFLSGDGIDVDIEEDNSGEINFAVNTNWLQAYITNNINNWGIDFDVDLTYNNTSEGFYVLGTTQATAGTIDTVYRRNTAIGNSTKPIYINSAGLALVIDSIDPDLLPDSVLTEDNVGDYVSFEQTLTSGEEIGKITINGETTTLYAPDGTGSSGNSDSYWYLSGSSLYAGTSTTPSYAAYATSFYETSDKNLKENIVDISYEALEKASLLHILQFNFKTGSKDTKYGVIAQEVEDAGLENLVSTSKDGTKAVDYISLLSLKVAKLEKENKSLKNENEELKARLEKIESLLNINLVE